MTEVVIRQVRASDLADCVRVESTCFLPAEAAPQANIQKRIDLFPDGFLVAEANGQLVGLVNSGATHLDGVGDEAFKKMIGHDSRGANLVIFSLAVLPAYRGQGIARQLLARLVDRARQMGKKTVLLICKAELVAFYESAGFVDAGESSSTHGGGQWHDMRLSLDSIE